MPSRVGQDAPRSASAVLTIAGGMNRLLWKTTPPKMGGTGVQPVAASYKRAAGFSADPAATVARQSSAGNTESGQISGRRRKDGEPVALHVDHYPLACRGLVEGLVEAS